jgi:hypothetical protein
LIHRRPKQLTQGGAWGEQGKVVELLLKAAAPPEATLTVTKCRPNHAVVARSPSTVSFAISLQNGFPLSSRSCRIKLHRVWCLMARACARPSRWPWHLPASVSPALLSQRRSCRRRPIPSRQSRLNRCVPLRPIKSSSWIRSPTDTF